MTTQYTPSLRLALPGTGELDGLWGQVVNDQITEMLEQAITGQTTINTWTANSHTLTSVDGTLDEARAAVLVAEDGSGNPSLPFSIVAPDADKLYVVVNQTSNILGITTSAPGAQVVNIPSGKTAMVAISGASVRLGSNFTTDLRATGRSIMDGAVAQSFTTIGSSSSISLDASVSNFYYMPTTPGGTVYVAFTSSAPSSLGVVNFLALLINPGTGTISWPSSVRWPNNTAPIINSNTYNLFLFTQYSSTSYWFGAVLNNYI